MLNYLFVKTKKDFDTALSAIKGSDILAVDTETSGLDPYKAQIWSIQIGTEKGESFLFPYNFMNEPEVKKLRLALADKLLIAHNAKFDAKMLIVNGFKINQVWCTQEAEKVLYAGKYYTWGLKDLLKRYFKIEVDKTIRDDFWDGTFENLVNSKGIKAWTDDYIYYAINDIVHLIPIYEKQLEEGNKRNIVDDVLAVEADLVIALSKMELRGVYIDTKELKKFKGLVLLRKDELESEASQQLEIFYKQSYQKKYAKMLDLWDKWKLEHEKVKEGRKERDAEQHRLAMEKSNKKKPYPAPPKPESEWNLASPQKLREALVEALGFELTTTNTEWLTENAGLHPVMLTLVEYRKFKKLTEFCEIGSEVNEVTNKIHPNYRQNGTQAGRLSCSQPNIQQMPSRGDEAKQFRALFKAQKGNKFIGADYSGIELVIIAHDANEKILIDAINDNKDLHCFTMGHLLNCDYDILIKSKDGIELTKKEDELLATARSKFENGFYLPQLEKKAHGTAWVKGFREYVKTITYGLAYGLSSFGLSRKFHCEVSVAELFIQNFFNVYPKIKLFLNKLEEKGIARLYAENTVGRRRYFSAPRKKTQQEVEKEVIKALNKDKREWESVDDDEWNDLMKEGMKQATKEYNGKFNSIRRQAGNFYPQSICAEMVKRATVSFEQLWNDDATGLILSIHDELIGEFREEDVEKAQKMLEEEMTKSAKEFLPNIKVKVDAVVMDYWEKG